MFLRVLDVDGADGGEVDGDGGDVQLEGCDDHDFANALGCGHGVEGDELEEGVEADHTEDDGDAAESEDGNDADLGAPRHLELPQGRNGEHEDVEV